MSFFSFRFIIFLVVVYLTYVKVKKRNYQIYILVLASYFFYAMWDYKALGLLLFQTVVSFLSGVLILKTENDHVRKRIEIIGIVLLLLVLGTFKYCNFFLESFCALLQIPNDYSIKIILPIGISFYTFQAISYVIDVYRGDVEAQPLRNVCLYVGFFPQLLSGPIVKAKDFIPQIKKRFVVNKQEVLLALQIFVNGIIKKYVIANRLSVCVDAVYSTPNAYSGLSLACAVVTYSFQLYCDFSGYSDIAVAIGKLFGFNLGRNFSIPYTTSNPSTFWKHWHISLSSWLQSYLYIPLGGNRKGTIRTYCNLMITMVMGGFWHGASWNFIIWGFLHGLGLIIHKVFKKNHVYFESSSSVSREMKYWFFVLINFVFVSICWVFFRTETLSSAIQILYRIITFADGVQYIYTYSLTYIVLVVVCNVISYYKNDGEGSYLLFELNKLSSLVLFFIVIWLIFLLAYFNNNPFVYAQF